MDTKMKILLILTAASTIFSAVWSLGDEDIRCVSTSCKDVECDAVPDKCKTNETNAGIYMLSPDICNCCDYCLVYMVEGEECSVGDPANAKHTSLCGPGLTCVPDDGETDGTCQKMSTSCALEQQSFDLRRKTGLLGLMETRATCDDDGLYGTYKCVPGQNCFCLHSNGSRIFGEANYNTIPDYMPCECSRAYYDAVDIIGRELHPHEHFRCDSAGNYDRIQCINEQCLCVDALDGAPTYPNKNLVDLDDIDNETLSCYTNGLMQGLYYKTCEEEYMIIHEEIETKKNESGYSLILGYTYPLCDLDGTYQAVQENQTHKYCVDKEGSIITSPMEKANTTLSTLIESMDCKCARSNILMTTAEKPDCLENGNYNPVQCRRNVCRCVDVDGNQKCSDSTYESTTACEEVEESAKASLKCT